MSENNPKVWKCEKCESLLTPCISNCRLICNEVAFWQLTADYEIVKKKSITPRRSLITDYPDSPVPNMRNIPPAPQKEAYLKTDYPELAKAVFPTPNCSICKWCEFQGLSYPVQCQCQGYKKSVDCYNSAECKALFEIDKEPEIGGKTPFEKAEHILRNCIMRNTDLNGNDSYYPRVTLEECKKLASQTSFNLLEIKKAFLD